ncbi:MAG TPA: hypothetical protein VG992_02915 [Candidatus Saccharimonadales bacterium]|nr:hypothetical protein [Candidatus Saccharimonadales bacterium]
MNKHHLHHSWTKLRWLKPWYFLIVAIISSVVCVLALRANNEHMITLRDAVYAADKNNADVRGALQHLQAYVTTHMNTSLSAGPNSVYPPIQLKYTYDRLFDEESAQAAAHNKRLYTDAQNYCQTEIPVGFSGRYRVPCIEQYVKTHDSELPQVPQALYMFDFASPTWSPDRAGWSMVVAILSAALFVITTLIRWLLRRLTK